MFHSAGRMCSWGMLAVGLACQSGPFLDPWELDAATGAVVHSPTGLSFPYGLGRLRRSGPGSTDNPYSPGAGSVAYHSPGKNWSVLVALLPESDPKDHSTPEALLRARLILAEGQEAALEEAIWTTRLVCGEDVVEFKSAVMHLTEHEESIHIAQIAGHLVYVRTRMREVPQEPGQVITTLASHLRWPCRPE